MAKPKRPEKKRKPKKKPARQEVVESGTIGSAPTAPQAGPAPQDYPEDAAAFGTGPAEAVQYHYTRQDLYNEQYAQEQLAAEQQSSSAGASAVPGPGTTGVRYG